MGVSVFFFCVCVCVCVWDFRVILFFFVFGWLVKLIRFLSNNLSHIHIETCTHQIVKGLLMMYICLLFCLQLIPNQFLKTSKLITSPKIG